MINADTTDKRTTNNVSRASRSLALVMRSLRCSALSFQGSIRVHHLNVISIMGLLRVISRCVELCSWP